MQVPAQGFDIYGQRYNAAAGKLGSEFRINTTQASDQTQPSIAKLQDGSFVVTWTSNLQDTSGLGVYAQRYSAAGSKTGNEFRVNTTIASNQSQPSVAGFTDKGFVIVWTSQDGSGLGVSAIAERLGVCSRTVRRWIEDELMIAHHIRGVVRIAESDLQAFLAAHRD